MAPVVTSTGAIQLIRQVLVQTDDLIFLQLNLELSAFINKGVFAGSIGFDPDVFEFFVFPVHLVDNYTAPCL